MLDLDPFRLADECADHVFREHRDRLRSIAELDFLVGGQVALVVLRKEVEEDGSVTIHESDDRAMPCRLATRVRCDALLDQKFPDRSIDHARLGAAHRLQEISIAQARLTSEARAFLRLADPHR